MINLHLNLSRSRSVQFSSTASLIKTVVLNPFKYDGLCLFVYGEDTKPLLELVYNEVYENWEVAEGDGTESTSYSTVKDAVTAFVVELQELGVCY